jgi:hypothetical protein
MSNWEIMPLNKAHGYLLLVLVCSSCVEPFEPDLDENQNVMVISGMITDRPGRHTISVSRSAPYQKPEYQPVEFCLVQVYRQDGNFIEYSDEGDGIYAADIPGSFLEPGDLVSLHVVTPDAREYRSDFDTLLTCPDLDRVYYELGYMETSDPEKSLPGVQFYLDMSGEPTDSRNILWQVEETWEYWASLFANRRWWSDGTMDDYQSHPLFKCWKHYPLPRFYTATTRNLSSNEIRRLSLNFVSNETDRLSVTYSILVKQQSLTNQAYNYFVRLHEQAVETGGLYDVQPLSVPGNIYSVDHAEETVLGFFHATQLKEEQIFVHNNNFFEFAIPHISCEYEPMSVIWEWPRIDWPVYIFAPGPFQPVWTALPECFNCLLQGGDTIRPVNWESWP